MNSDSPRSASTTPESLARSLPRQFGRYELLQELGRGGAGVIFKARQPDLDRLCAVKMLHEASGAEAARTALLLAEARAAAVLDHPNIVGIYEVGEAEGHPFYSMEFVAGENLTAFVRSRMIPASKAAEYVEKIASAIEYAHSRGVTHCDLKPANVLIDPRDEPQITDFGLARRAGGVTAAIQADPAAGAGSPNFMAPEQGSDRFGSIGVRTDVFGIGAILYYLLTDRPPFRGETVADTIQAVLQQDPVRPRALRPGVPIDLETICLKCLEKRPVRRYQSAGEVAEELRRFLRDEPIHARRISQVERAWRFARRHPMLSGFAGATLGLLTLIAVGSPILAFRINQARETAEQQRRRAEANELRVRRQLYAVQFQEAVQAAESGDTRRAQVLLDGQGPVGDGASSSVDVRGWEWRYLSTRLHIPEAPALPESSVPLLDVAKMDQGRALLLLRADGTLESVANATDRSAPKVFSWVFGVPGPTNQFGVLALSRDGSRAAVSRSNLDSTNSEIVVVGTRDWRAQARLSVAGAAGSMVFLPDGETLALLVGIRDGEWMRWTAERWEWQTGRRSPLVSLGARRRLSIPVIDPAGTRCAWAMDDGQIEVRDRLRGASPVQLQGHVFEPGWAVLLGNLEFLPDGRRLVSAGVDKTVRIWDLGARTNLILRGHSDAVNSVAVSPDGRRIATASRDRTIRLWDADSGAELGVLTGGGAAPPNLTFSADGGTLMVWGEADRRPQNTIRFFDLQQSLKRVVPEAEADSDTMWTELLPDAQHWWTVTPDQVWTLHRLGSAAPLARIADTNVVGVRARTFDPMSRQVAYVSTQGLLTVQRVDTGAIRKWSLEHPSSKSSVRFSLDGRLLAVGLGDWQLSGPDVRQWLQVWEVESQRKVHEFEGRFDRFRFSDNNQWLVVSDGRGKVRLHNLVQGSTRELGSFSAAVQIPGLAFSPGASEVAAGGVDGTIKLWSTATGKELATFDSHTSGVLTLTFSPSGDRLISGSLDGALQVWDPRNQLRLATFHTGSKGITSLSFRDTDTLVSGDLGAIRIWKAKAATQDTADEARKLL